MISKLIALVCSVKLTIYLLLLPRLGRIGDVSVLSCVAVAGYWGSFNSGVPTYRMRR
jgi:hypothetical protein